MFVSAIPSLLCCSHSGIIQKVGLNLLPWYNEWWWHICGMVVQYLGHWTSDLQVVGLIYYIIVMLLQFGTKGA